MIIDSNIATCSKRIKNMPLIHLAGRFHEKREVSNHAHDFEEFIFVTQGKCAIQSDQTTFTGGPGSLFVIPAHLQHYQPDTGLLGTTYIGFDSHDPQFDNSLRMIPLSTEVYISRWIEDIVDLHTAIYNNEAYIEAVAGIIKAIMTRLMQIDSHNHTIASIHPRLKEALEFIETHLTEPLNMEDIADSVDMSESHLSALFREFIGSAPLQYQQKMRMRLACKHLLNPYITVKKAAEMCGYEDANYFIRHFRKHYEMSPGKWRNQFRKPGLYYAQPENQKT